MHKFINSACLVSLAFLECNDFRSEDLVLNNQLGALSMGVINYPFSFV